MTWANKLTILRMALVPVFAFFILQGQLGGAILILFLAGLTDMLDGLIARNFGQRTSLGVVLDPAADKLLLTTSFIILSVDSPSLISPIPVWLTAVVIGRDVLLISSAALLSLFYGPRTFPPSIYGKATTAAQLLTVLLVLVVNFLKVEAGFLHLLFYLTLLLTVVSGIHYLGRGIRVVQAEGTRKEA